MKNKINFYTVVMCGGSGKRLWPLSRNFYPKQFLKIDDNYSFLQNTILRIIKLNIANYNLNKIVIVSNFEYRFILHEQISELGLLDKCFFVYEPCQKNTAPALTISSLYLKKIDKNPIILAIPSDQFYSNQRDFNKVVRECLNNASLSKLSIVGIRPTSPDTGYGYIKFDAKRNNQLLNFFEKPNQRNAALYAKKNDFLWNAGVFVLRAELWISLMRKYSEKYLFELLNCYENSYCEKNQLVIPEILFNQIKSNSIDYEIMEKLDDKDKKNTYVSKLDSDWSDLGSFDSVVNRYNDSIKYSNSKNVFSNNSGGNFVFSNKEVIALESVKDLIIIDSNDSLLISKRGSTQNVKKIVDKIELKLPHIIDEPQKSYRPWGWFEIIDEGNFFKVKKICVKPKHSLSLQTHKFRSEHWIVIKGKAKIINDNKSYILKQNESSFIPSKTKHRLSNPYSIDLQIIEVQTGSYLGEDDIIRHEDIYGRKK